jgi:hypothetical protein
VSWSVLVSPPHRVAADGGPGWAAEASFAYGVPDEAPTARELPTVADVLAAFRAAGCHGTAWFEVAGSDAADRAFVVSPGDRAEDLILHWPW